MTYAGLMCACCSEVACIINHYPEPYYMMRPADCCLPDGTPIVPKSNAECWNCGFSMQMWRELLVEMPVGWSPPRAD